MGLENEITEYFSVEQVLPASGQGILAIETLSGKEEKLLSAVNHAETLGIALAEMSFLKALNAGCQFPVASHAEIVDDGRAAAGCPAVLRMRGIYWLESTQKLLRAKLQTEIPATADNSWFIAQGESLAAQIKAQF